MIAPAQKLCEGITVSEGVLARPCAGKPFPSQLKCVGVVARTPSCDTWRHTLRWSPEAGQLPSSGEERDRSLEKRQKQPAADDDCQRDQRLIKSKSSRFLVGHRHIHQHRPPTGIDEDNHLLPFAGRRSASAVVCEPFFEVAKRMPNDTNTGGEPVLHRFQTASSRPFPSCERGHRCLGD